MYMYVLTWYGPKYICKDLNKIQVLQLLVAEVKAVVGAVHNLHVKLLM